MSLVVDRSVEAVRVDHFEQLVVVAMVDVNAEVETWNSVCTGMPRYLDKAAVTTADSSMRKRAISWSKAILRDFGISALTNGIVTLN